MKYDLNGNGKADILVTSSWGLGVLGLSQSKITEYTMSPNGARFGDWLLNTKDNNVELKADLDGDGKDEVLMSSPWGVGILKLTHGQLSSIAMAKNGTRHGGWIINTADNQFLFAADFDGDEREEILVTSPWGIGILKYSNHQITSLMLSPNGTRFGGWLLNTKDNYFTLVGDFDGDGKKEIVVTSPWGLGILKFKGTTLTSIVMAANGTQFGDWTLDTSIDRFEVVGDFNGDGKDEILVSNVNQIGVLKLNTDHLISVFVANSGDRLGSWVLNSAKNQMSSVGDFDGDGKDEILITSDWGLGLLKLNANILQSTVMASSGTRFGDWLLNTRDNCLNYVADFDGDGKDEILISSPWGIGILKQSGHTFDAITMSPNSTRFGDWLLNTQDNDLESGLGQSYAVIIYHHQWQGAVDHTAKYLKSRGYTVFVISNGHEGIAVLKNLALYLKAGDKIFVYLAGHGNTGRTIGKTEKELSLTHGLQFEDGALVTYDKFSPSFQLMGNKGIDLSVFDGSCDGGEAVFNAIGERYLAMSTTAVCAPGITNTPDPSGIMKLFGKPSMFGLWWSSQYTASLLTSKTPHRFYQKIYRNDNTEINIQSLFYRTAIYFYTTLGGGWYLQHGHCYLYQYIYPDDYQLLSQADKNSLTVSADDYLVSKQGNFDIYALSIKQLKDMLHTANFIDKASEVYMQSFPKPWQTIFGDMNWDVVAEPIRHSSKNNALAPGYYTGRAGFVRMVNESLNLIALLEQCYYRTKNVLKQIDTEIQKRKLYTGIFKAQPSVKEKITDYLKYNEYDQKREIHIENILNQLSVDRTKFFKKLGEPTEKIQHKTTFAEMLDKDLSGIHPYVKKDSARGTSIDDLIAELESVSVASSVYLDKLFYLLIIVEEAISHVQRKGIAPGDIIKY